MATKPLIKHLASIQQTLKAPKNQYNSFGKYKYRNCEDILEAVKPLLDNTILLLNDEVVELSGRWYVKATATLTDGEDKIETTAYARESEDKKGMDDAQITGAASSYARKYALNALFAIDDTKDADSKDNSVKKKTLKKEECEHKNQATHQVKKEGKNKGKYYTACNDCKSFLKFL